MGGDSGLARSNPDSQGSIVHLDTASLIASIQDEIAKLRDVPDRPSDGLSLGPRRQLKLLRKLGDICLPERQVIARRGERRPMAMTVEVAVGLPQILRTMRNKPEVTVAAAARTTAATTAAARTAAAAEGITIMGYGGLAGDPAEGNLSGGESTITQWSTPGTIAAHPPLTMVDQSDSGCRLHGPTLSTNPIMPGTLIAFRENVAAPWTVGVVRRAKKRLAGKRVEIGVEFLGRDPRWVVVVVPDAETSSDRPSESAAPRFAALYLPQSATHPVLPMKTLILPTRGLAPDDRLSVRSRTSVHTIQLKEPLDEQAEFIWSPFEVLERWLKDQPAST